MRVNISHFLGPDKDLRVKSFNGDNEYNKLVRRLQGVRWIHSGKSTEEKHMQIWDTWQEIQNCWWVAHLNDSGGGLKEKKKVDGRCGLRWANEQRESGSAEGSGLMGS